MENSVIDPPYNQRGESTRFWQYNPWSYVFSIIFLGLVNDLNLFIVKQITIQKYDVTIKTEESSNPYDPVVFPFKLDKTYFESIHFKTKGFDKSYENLEALQIEESFNVKDKVQKQEYLHKILGFELKGKLMMQGKITNNEVTVKKEPCK